MHLLLIWGSTIVLSYAMDLIKDASLIKRVVESGYKVDLDKYNKTISSINSNTKKEDIFNRYFPIWNVLYSMKNGLECMSQIDDALYELSIIGCLEELTEEEKEEYNKNPNCIKALSIGFGMKSNKKKSCIKLDTKENGTIYFKFEKGGTITIIKRVGKVSKLSEDEIFDLINDEIYNKKMKAFQSINYDTESLFPEEEKLDEDRTEITIDYVERILNEYRKIRDDILNKKEEMSKAETIEELNKKYQELTEEEKGPTKKL